MSVRVNNFDSIEAFQLSINFDPYLLDFDSLGRLNSDIGLTEGFFGLQEKHLGIIRLTFFDPFVSHVLPDSSILFDICFTAYGLPDEICPVNIADFPLPLEVISKEQVIPSTRQDARVNIQGGSELTLLTSTCKTGIDDSTGSLSVTVYGGNPPYFAIWQHTFNSGFSGGFGLDTFGETMVVNDLIEGRYRISITDEDGTRIQDSLNLRKANDLVYTTELIHPTCDNTLDGAIIIDSLQGGIVPPQFKWDDGHLFSQRRFDLMVGDYFITITDPLGCRTLDTFVLEANSIQATTDIFDETCLDAGDGKFSISVDGGQPFDSLGYEIIYNGDTLFGFSVSDSMLMVGEYKVQISDSIGCIKFVDVSIGTGLSFGVQDLIVDQVSCFGDSSASIFLRPATLTGNEILPYTFAWTGTDSATVDSSSILLHHLGIGSYTITVENAAIAGCTWDTTFLINQPPFMSVSTSNIVPASCVPDGDGQATIDILGGTPDGEGDYLVIWDNGSDSITGTNLNSGLHTVTVIDLEGCRATHEVDLPTTTPPLLIGSSVRDFRCDSMAIGSILTIFSSQFGIESYLWSTGETTSSIDGLLPGDYSCIVEDKNGCIDTFYFDAPSPEGPEISDLIVQNIQCFGDSNGRLDVVYDVGVGDIDRVEWNGSNGGDSLLNLRSGGYKVVIYDVNGCVDSAATTLVNPELLDMTFNISDDTSLLHTGAIEAEVTGGWSPYSFAWSPGAFIDSNYIDSLGAGTYYLKLTDAEGCMLQDSAVVGFVSGISQLKLGEDFNLSPNPTSSFLTFDWHLPSETMIDQIVIFNTQGKRQLVRNVMRNTGAIELDVTALTTGPYWFTIWERKQLRGISMFQKYD